MSIVVEFLAGTDIKHALIEASHKASCWGVAYVKFKFNGVSISVRGDRTEEEIEHAVKQYQMALDKNSKHNFVIC